MMSWSEKLHLQKQVILEFDIESGKITQIMPGDSMRKPWADAAIGDGLKT